MEEDVQAVLLDLFEYVMAGRGGLRLADRGCVLGKAFSTAVCEYVDDDFQDGDDFA